MSIRRNVPGTTYLGMVAGPKNPAPHFRANGVSMQCDGQASGKKTATREARKRDEKGKGRKREEIQSRAHHPMITILMSSIGSKGIDHGQSLRQHARFFLVWHSEDSVCVAALMPSN
jgi:hypothetical protein